MYGKVRVLFGVVKYSEVLNIVLVEWCDVPLCDACVKYMQSRERCGSVNKCM